MEILYFKAPRMVNIIQKKNITVSDLGELQGNPELVYQAKSLQVTHLTGNEKQRKLISIMDVIQTVQQNLKDTCVVNIGSPDIILSFKPQEEAKKSPVGNWIKTGIICCILFCGAMFAIMTFQTDAGVPDVFIEINRIFTGQEEQRPFWLIGSYAVGISVGITVFFNHFSKKRLSDDPTPVEVEFADYEKKVEDCLQDMLSDDTNYGQGKLSGNTREAGK